MNPFEEAAALAQDLPQLTPSVQFELALLLLDELELDDEDLQRLHEVIG